MATQLIIDNWTLQNTGECLSEGLSHETSHELVISEPEDNHLVKDIPLAGVQIEALLGLLVDIVFRDSLIVDSEYTYTWAPYEENFHHLLQSGLVRPLPFLTYEDRLVEPRRFVVNQLCITSTLRDAQRRNEESWGARKQADNPYMSTVIWGAAGMLSRSHVFEASYSAHPLRKRLIEQTILKSPKQDMVAEVLEWVAGERLRLFETRTHDTVKKAAIIVLPPVAIDIIEESRDVNDLVPVAFQLREKYAKMREWVNSVQMAIDTEDAKQIARHKKTLHAVSNDVDRAMRAVDKGKIALTIGFGWPNLSIPLGTLDGVMKNFGMRAILNNQIFSPRGEKSLKKLLGMFSEGSSGLGMAVQDYLRK